MTTTAAALFLSGFGELWAPSSNLIVAFVNDTLGYISGVFILCFYFYTLQWWKCIQLEREQLN